MEISRNKVETSRNNLFQFISRSAKWRRARFYLFLPTVFVFLYFYIFISEASAVTGVALPNPLGTTNIREIIGNMIHMMIGGAGAVSLLMFVYGGFLWLTSAGNAEKIKKGQTIILWAVLGLVVIFSSYIIVRYVLGGILDAAAI